MIRIIRNSSVQQQAIQICDATNHPRVLTILKISKYEIQFDIQNRNVEPTRKVIINNAWKMNIKTFKCMIKYNFFDLIQQFSSQYILKPLSNDNTTNQPRASRSSPEMRSGQISCGRQNLPIQSAELAGGIAKGMPSTSLQDWKAVAPLLPQKCRWYDAGDSRYQRKSIQHSYKLVKKLHITKATL
ncbi:Hypothetical_protein [Hexamita inflata]|uniref:Hypothetical_protein n=1 Tax=Hexamita inflata TaxID=28002 RepID=A0ABP1J6T1_9EUKA